MRTLACVLALAVLVPPAAFADGAAPPEVVESPRAARPLLVVPPEFPPNVDQLQEPVVVDVVGNIQKNGQLNVRSVSGDPRFAQSVSDVLKWWRFGPAVEECHAVEGEIFARVSFSGSTADPHVFVSTPERQTSKRNAEVLASFEWSKRASPDWPMHTRSREGDVRLLYQLMPDGAVSDASVYSSFPQGDFDDEALYAVRQWKAKWLHEPPQEPICMEQRILFCQREPGKKVSVVGCQ